MQLTLVLERKDLPARFQHIEFDLIKLDLFKTSVPQMILNNADTIRYLDDTGRTKTFKRDTSKDASLFEK